MLFLSMARPDRPIKDGSPLCGVELRLDLFPHVDLACIKKYIQISDQPVILTLRKASQGGKFQGTELEREKFVKQLLRLAPSFFDLEYDTDPDFINEVIQSFPKTRFILSYHNFCGTPSDLDMLYRTMQTYSAFHYKIATMAHSANDALKMLLFARRHPNLSVICMGEKGEFARVLGPIAGNKINYASPNANEQTAPGQLTATTLMDIYRYPDLTSQTAIYGLIGTPVINSRGHHYHNSVFRERGVNAVYVKMSVNAQELNEFIPLAKKFNIQGLSVTAPLKEAILPFVDEVDRKAHRIGAVNTLRFDNGRIRGTNTDGEGALDALENKTSVQGKKIVLLGAGGAARSIAFEAKARGAEVVVLNRTLERAKKVGADIGCEAGGLNAIPNYDILINCSPDPMPINSKKIQEGKVVMDVVYYPRERSFLKEASAKGCQIVYGEEMFLNQAARQTAFWLGLQHK